MKKSHFISFRIVFCCWVMGLSGICLYPREGSTQQASSPLSASSLADPISPDQATPPCTGNENAATLNQDAQRILQAYETAKADLIAGKGAMTYEGLLQLYADSQRRLNEIEAACQCVHGQTVDSAATDTQTYFISTDDGAEPPGEGGDEAPPVKLTPEEERKLEEAKARPPSTLAAVRILIHGIQIPPDGQWDPNDIKSVALSYGISEDEARQALDQILKTRSINRLLQDLAKLVKDNNEMLDIRRDPETEKEHFIKYVLDPYLALLEASNRRNQPLGKELDESIIKSFERIFKVDPKDNPLRKFIELYRQGKTDARVNAALNDILSKSNYRYSFGRDNILYEIIKKIPVDERGIKDVVILRKAGVNLERAAHGVSTLGEDDVSLIEQTLDQKAEEINGLVKDKDTKYPAGPADQAPNKLANILGSDPNAFQKEQKKIKKWLYDKDFKNLSPEDRLKALKHTTAIHELKHKFDEKMGAALGRLNVDLERSAYKTAIVHGAAPHYALQSWIEYLMTLNIRGNDPAYQQELREAVEVARKVASGQMSEKELRKWAEESYAKDKSTRPWLPTLDSFQGVADQFSKSSKKQK